MEGSESAAIFSKLQSMTPSHAAQSLDLTRKQEYDIVRKGEKTAEEREALWMQVWVWFRASARHPFAAKATDPAVLNALCFGAKAWDEEWSHLGALTIGPNMQSMPHRYLSLCFYYASYVANVYRYVRQTVEDTDAPADVEVAVSIYHREVSSVLNLLKGRVGRPILEVAILSSASRVKHHLFHELFGYPKGGPPADSTMRLYLPAQLLFHGWTAINMDGRAFRMYHVMFEFDWMGRVGWKDSLRALRLSYLDNTVCLGRVLTIPKLDELSIRSGKEYTRGVNLFDKQTSVISNLSKLLLVDLPSLRRLGSDGVVFQRLKELHLENLSFPGFPLAAFFQAPPPPPLPLKKLILRGPRLAVPPRMDEWLVLPSSLSEIVLDNLPGVSSLPLAKSPIASVTLANLTLPWLRYMSFVSSAGPTKLVLDTLRVVEPQRDVFPGAIPVIHDMFNTELKGIINANGTWNRLTECTLSGFVHVTDFTGVFERAAATLERLAIYGSVGHISLPFRELRALKDVKIDKASGVSLSERLTPTSRAYWTRQALIIADGGGGGAEAAVSPPRKKLDFDDKGKEEEEEDDAGAGGQMSAAAAPLDIFSDDEEPVSDIFASLEDMLIPFGAGRDKMSGQLSIPPWLPRNLEEMGDNDPNKRLFASTWLEWETAVSSWLASEDEGLLLYPAIGDLRISKVVERDDGEPFAIIFTTAGLPQAPPPPKGTAGRGEAEKMLYSERNKFLAGLLSQEFPVVLRYSRKERVIGRNEQTGAVVTSDGINLTFPLETLSQDDGILAGIVFNSDEFVDEKDGLSKSCRVGFNDTRARVKLDLGKLTLLFKREDDPFPTGFSFRITLAAAVRFLAVQSAVLLSFQDVGLRDKLNLGGEGEEAAADESEDLLGVLSRQLKARETTFRPGEYKNQLAMLSALSASRGVAASTPFFFDETNERVLEAVREEPFRQLMAGSLLLVYAQALGLRHLLSLKDPRKGRGVLWAGTKILPSGRPAPLMRDMVLYEHLTQVVMPKYLEPVAAWCIAWSPSEGGEGGEAEAQSESVSSSASILVALVQEMGDRLLVPLGAGQLADAYAYVLEQLIPAPDLPDDDEVMAFSATREGFAQLVAEMIDDGVTFTEEVRTRMTEVLRVIDTELDHLTAEFLEAKVKHSGDGQYLDTAQMAAYVKTVYPAERVERMVADIVKAINTIVGSVKGAAEHEAALDEQAMAATATSPTTTATSPIVGQPSRKRFKQDLRAASRSPSQSPDRLTGLLPSPQKSTPPPVAAKLTIVNSPKRSVVFIDLVTPPGSPVEKDQVEVIDLTSPLKSSSSSSSSSSASSTPSSQLSPEERQRREDRRMDAEQEAEEEREELEEMRRAAEEEAENIKGVIEQQQQQFVCAHCGDEGPEKSVCSQCRSVFYCGGECQRQHWPNHKVVCGRQQQQHP